MLDFANKVVIVTGGTRGMGLEIVRAFCERKAQVILFGSKLDTVKEAVLKLSAEGKMVCGYYPNLSNLVELIF